MEHAAEHGLVFATDPTSAWACTIGGNIAENAGGKDCVLYGTCIDNLVSWRMAMPSGRRWEIRRADHQLRKILPEDTVTFEVVDEHGGRLRRIRLRGDRHPQEGALEGHHQQGARRRPGPAEGGDRRRHHLGRVHPLPGVRGQADALPGVLRPGLRRGVAGDPRARARVPLPERGAGGALGARALRRRVRPRHPVQGEGAARGDAEGGAARGRRRPRARGGRARGGPDPAASSTAHPNTLRLRGARRGRGEALLGRPQEARRHRAAHERLQDERGRGPPARRARRVRALRRGGERRGGAVRAVRFVERAQEILRAAAPPASDPEWLAAKIPAALERFERARDAIARSAERDLRSLAILRALQREVSQLVRGYPEITKRLEQAHKEVRDRLIVLATHMHAGDGNVHVNVPVLSNDRPMLQRAERVIDRVMEKVVALGGVVSGEHGIGVTKLKYLEPERIAELSAHRREVDPAGLMNPGQARGPRRPRPDLHALLQPARARGAHPPARPARGAGAVDRALRPLRQVQAGLLRLPPGARAVLPPAQQEPRHRVAHRGAPLRRAARALDPVRAAPLARGRRRSLHHLPQVPEAVPGRHRLGRGLGAGARDPRSAGATRTRPLATRAALGYLDSRSPAYNKVFRSTVVRLGGAVQRAACELAAPFQPADGRPGAVPAAAAPLADAGDPGGDAAGRDPALRARPGARVRAARRPDGRRTGGANGERAADAGSGPSSTSRAAARSGSSRTSRWRRCTSC